ncbi:NAD(P)-binding protein [Phanerochaete sordida]|uniref:NAD(P)-binding protein n=1 Tax=Phanerochaete sordida TaxID=48140 RepID=A0A9P3GBB0_9APHY|nr:NAD(P)-binding protein [Phanerochaete sordida]
MSSPRVWLITGSSTGFGRNMVEYALSQGEKVVATLRTPSALDDLRAQFPPTQLHIVPLDITDRAAISAAFAAAKAAFGRVDVVFNNAGVVHVAEIEGTPDAVAREMFAVNFWGAADVAREAVRFFREENPAGAGGWLLNVSSITGVQPLTAVGYYSSSKAAFDAFTQALAAEVDPAWNIKVVGILPDFFRTPIAVKGPVIPPHPAYVATTAEARRHIAVSFDPHGGVRIGNPKKAMPRIFALTRLAKPPVRLFLGHTAVEDARIKIKSLSEDVEAYAAWSEGLLEDE